VFSHGFLMDHEMFVEQVDVFAPDHLCVSWDQRGHGATTNEGQFDIWDGARDLIALMDELELESAVLAGMSQGGFISLRVALLAPERVKGLFLIDSQAGPELADMLPMYEAMAATWAAGGATPELAEMVAGLIVGPADHTPWVEKWLARPPEEITPIARCLFDRDDITARLHEIAAPALVVHGTQDASIPMELGEELAHGLPGASGVVRIEGAGHAANLSHPEEVNAALRDLLERLER
jgi:3-oxoadipate enol-lactonase